MGIALGALGTYVITAMALSTQPTYIPKQPADASFVLHMPPKCALQAYVLLHDKSKARVTPEVLEQLNDLAKHCGGKLAEDHN